MFDREKLKELRKGLLDEKGKPWSQDKLSKEIGLYSGTISRLERGTSGDPDPTTVAKIASYFGLSRDDLYVKDKEDQRSQREIEEDFNATCRRHKLSHEVVGELRRLLERARGLRSAASATSPKVRKGARGERSTS